MKDISLTIDARVIRNSGIGVYFQSLLPHILESGRFRVTLLGKTNDMEEALQRELQDVMVINCNSGIYSTQEQIEIPLKIRPCDIFWSPHYNIPLLPVRARKRVVTIHDAYHLAYIKTLGLLAKMYARVVLPAAANASHKVITVSNFSRDEIVRYTGVRQEKIEVIHNGVDYERFSKARDHQAISSTEDYILYVGNVKPHKNIMGLIHAFALFHESFPEVRLVIVGKKDDFITGIQNLDRFVSTLGIDRHVLFTGLVDNDDLYKLYGKARVFVFPSFYEGFGLPPLEAMASGVPVAASRAASIPEVCGDAAMYVDPNDAHDIARGMTAVFSNDTLRDELIRKGKERARLFSWEASAARHISIFLELCNIM